MKLLYASTMVLFVLSAASPGLADVFSADAVAPNPLRDSSSVQNGTSTESQSGVQARRPSESIFVVPVELKPDPELEALRAEPAYQIPRLDN